MIRANSVFLVFSFLILWPLPAQAQVLPGLAHQLEVADGADSEDPALEAVTHDPDWDGALIGAGVGAAGLSIIWYVTCDQGDLCVLAVVGGTLIGGLAGLILGGLLDAADPLTPRNESPRAVLRDSIPAAVSEEEGDSP